MTLEERMHNDLSSAMRKKDELVMMTLRMTLAAFHSRSIEKKGKGEDTVLSDEEATSIVTREVKKRKESAEAFLKGGRADLGEKEMKECAILEAYIPAQVDDATLEKEVDAVIQKTAPEGMKDFGKVMSVATKSLKGRADGTRIATCVRKKLASEA